MCGTVYRIWELKIDIFRDGRSTNDLRSRHDETRRSASLSPIIHRVLESTDFDLSEDGRNGGTGIVMARMHIRNYGNSTLA